MISAATLLCTGFYNNQTAPRPPIKCIPHVRSYRTFPGGKSSPPLPWFLRGGSKGAIFGLMAE